jgi:hypothetical protein
MGRHRRVLIALADALVDFTSVARCDGWQNHANLRCPRHHPDAYVKVARHRGPKHRRTYPYTLPSWDLPSLALCTAEWPGWHIALCPAHHPESYVNAGAKHITLPA